MQIDGICDRTEQWQIQNFARRGKTGVMRGEKGKLMAVVLGALSVPPAGLSKIPTFYILSCILFTLDGSQCGVMV